MSDPNKNNASTLQSYIDSAIGAGQAALGNLTGNTADQTQGEARKTQGGAEYDASHATAKLPGGAISGSGAISKDDPDRTAGSWNQTVGSAKEAVGGLIGSESLKSAGRQQNLEGQQQEAKGQLNDLSSGIGSRIQGTVGGAVAGATGDSEGQAHYDQMRAEGKTQQRGVEHDLQKQAEAEHQRRENA